MLYRQLFNFFAALPDLKGKWCLYSICEMHETDPIYRLILTALWEQTRMFHLHPIWRWNEEWPRSSWTVLMLNCSPARDVNRLPKQSQRCSTCRSPNVHFTSIALQIRFSIHIFRPVFVLFFTRVYLETCYTSMLCMNTVPRRMKLS